MKALRWIILAGLIVAALILSDFPPAWAVYWNSAIRTSLPPDSSRQQIEDWLKARQRRYFYRDYPPKPPADVPTPLSGLGATHHTGGALDRIGNETVAERASVDSAKLGGYINASFPCQGPLSNWYSMRVYFFLDRHGKLIKHSIEVLGEGL